jgi:homoisocitrate dehydrogenase
MKILLIPGDGIGPEVVEAARRVLVAFGAELEYDYAPAGFAAYQQFGTPLPAQTLQKAKEAKAILFGAVTTPPNIANYFSPIVRLRKELDLFANIRPFQFLPVPNCRPDLDLVIVRENTEDLYTGVERETKEGAVAERVITRRACERILWQAFELAKSQHRSKVTVVHKANVLRLTDGLFLDTAKSIAKNYPQIVMEEALVDSTAMKLIQSPESFEILVTTNMFGDILSDEVAALAGGLGVAASANLGQAQALFEPVHGSAPDIAGQGVANPTATILASCLMLDYLGQTEPARKIRRAVEETLATGQLTPDLGGSLKTEAFINQLLTKTVL